MRIVAIVSRGEIKETHDQKKKARACQCQCSTFEMRFWYANRGNVGMDLHVSACTFPVLESAKAHPSSTHDRMGGSRCAIQRISY